MQDTEEIMINAFYGHLKGLMNHLAVFKDQEIRYVVSGGNEACLKLFLAESVDAIVRNKALWTFDFNQTPNSSSPTQLIQADLSESVIDLIKSYQTKTPEIFPFIIDLLLNLPTKEVVSRDILHGFCRSSAKFRGKYIDEDLEVFYLDKAQEAGLHRSLNRTMPNGKEYYDTDDYLAVYNHALKAFSEKYPSFTDVTESEHIFGYSPKNLIKSNHTKAETVRDYLEIMKSCHFEGISQEDRIRFEFFQHDKSIFTSDLSSVQNHLAGKEHPAVDNTQIDLYANRAVDKAWFQIDYLTSRYHESSLAKLSEKVLNETLEPAVADCIFNPATAFIHRACWIYKISNEDDNLIHGENGAPTVNVIMRALLKLQDRGVDLFETDNNARSVMDVIHQEFAEKVKAPAVLSYIEHAVFQSQQQYSDDIDNQNESDAISAFTI